MAKEHESNRIAWNEAAVAYQRDLQKDVELLKSGGITLETAELRLLAPFHNKLNRCIHLQCAGGTDSLSLINLGAKEVIGIDISDDMIKVAEEKTAALGMNARWIRSDVIRVPNTLDGTADLVYTGKGALIWMMNIDAWAQVVARLLKPGGHLFIFEGHPFTYFFDINSKGLQIDPKYHGYFYEKTYESTSWPETYVGKVKPVESEQAIKYERVWPVSVVINALIAAGLQIERFEEYSDKYWDEFPNMPDDVRTRFPNTYSILAEKMK